MTVPFDLGIGSPLAVSDAAVATLAPEERIERVRALIPESMQILDDAIDEHVRASGHRLAGIVVLFSGGNDSTTLLHIMRDRATHAAHANTTIGIEQTRDFVRNVCDEWGLPLIERKPPRESDRYRAVVLDRGFPGPAMHHKMYTRLKERALHEVRRELVSDPRRERVVFVAGRRRSESQRRASVPQSERVGSIVWVSPLVNWTKLDLNTYRRQHDVPRNPVADLLHMSGECLCGSFASPGERAEIEHFFPDAMASIREIEAEIANRDDIPAHCRIWGWHADAKLRALAGPVDVPTTTGRLCSSCDARFVQAAFDDEGITA